MCLAVMDIRNNEIETTYFSHPKATLPVEMEPGQMRYVAWGRRLHEKSEMPIGRYAKLESLKQGIWDQFFPKAVKIRVSNFAEANKHTDEIQWKPVIKGSYIQGVLARYEDELRVYVVAIQPPPDSIFSRWPRILASRN
jgi:hypothetical protein